MATFVNYTCTNFIKLTLILAFNRRASTVVETPGQNKGMISIIPLSLRFKFGSLPPPVPSGTSKVTKKSHWARCLFHFYRLLLCCKKFNSDLRGRKTAFVDTFSHSACVWVAFSTTFRVAGLATWSFKRNTAAAAKIIILTRKKQQLISPSATKIIYCQ